MQSLRLQLIRKIIPTTTILIVFSLGCSNIGNKLNEKNDNLFNAEGVHAAFYNSTGDKIAISTATGRLILTDSTLLILYQKKIHIGSIYSSFFSSNSEYIITGGQDSLIIITHAKNFNIQEKYYFGFASWTSVYGYNTLGGCGEDGKLLIYDKVNNDTIVQILEGGAFFLYYIRPDTSLLVSSGLSGYEFDILQKKLTHTYHGTDLVYCIMPSNDEQKVVTASKDSTVNIFDRFTEKIIYSSEKLDGAVYVACFNNNDSIIAASTSAGSIYFMDRTLSEIYLKIKAFDTRVNTIHYSPCGTKILAGSEGGGAKIFSTVTGEMLYELDYSSLE